MNPKNPSQPLPGRSPQSKGHALKQFIDTLVNSLPTRAQGNDDQLGLVYLGNVHDAIPRLLILDQGLRLEERCVWQVMRISITDPGRPASLLTQSQLSRQCCVDIKTMRRYLHALRATRWITRCAMVHGRGTVWALHDEPLSVADTLLLDPGYMQFINECAHGNHKRLSELGQAIFTTFQEDVAHGHDYSQPVTQLEQAARRLDALTETPRQNAISTFFATPPSTHENSSNIERREKFPVDNRREIFPTQPDLSTVGKISLRGKSVREENSSLAGNLSCCSSNSLENKDLYKNTTATTNRPPIEIQGNTREENFSRRTEPARQTQPDWTKQLQWSSQLKEQEKLLILPVLTASGVSFETAQYLLNYLTDRLAAAKRGDAAAVPNPVGYLIQLSKLHAQGQLQPSSWGLRKAAPAQAAVADIPDVKSIQPATNKLDPAQKEQALKNLAALKKQLRTY